jgi:hypothetical protein
MRNGTIDRPILDELLCLNSWPENTVGFHNENLLIKEIKKLCDIHGYGRMHQLLDNIHTIWREPESVEVFKNARIERLQLIGIK